MKNGKSINITPKYVCFENEGDTIVGRFLSRSPVQSQTNQKVYFQYLFDTDEGLMKFHLGSATDGEAGCVMAEGDVYYVEFLGKEKIGNNKSVNKYHIEEIPIDSPEKKVQS